MRLAAQNLSFPIIEKKDVRFDTELSIEEEVIYRFHQHFLFL